MRTIFFTLILLFLANVPEMDAQRRVNYQDLVSRSEQPEVYVEYVALPAPDGSYLFNIAFRLGYDLLPFVRVRPDYSGDENGFEFYSPIRINAEILRGNSEDIRGEPLPVSNSTWSDTAYAATYEQTQSKTDQIEGAVGMSLTPGEYQLLLHLNRGETSRESRSRNLDFTVDDYEDASGGAFVILEEYEGGTTEVSVRMVNFGNYVLYGQNYTLLTLLPEDAPEGGYQLTIHRLDAGTGSDVTGSPLLEYPVRSEELIYTDGFYRKEGDKGPLIHFNRTEDGFPLLITEIPNREYPNSAFRISLMSEGNPEPVIEKEINSRWIDIPVSLLNLDVSINMLRFIVEDDVIDEMKRGTSTQKEQKFREFWSEKDPTSDTEFNELMAEYYRRIDYAFENFTTYEQAGYNSDQGQAYIRLGPPRSRERQLPVDGPAREVWIYSGQTLIFEATTGFGDYKLIGRE